MTLSPGQYPIDLWLHLLKPDPLIPVIAFLCSRGSRPLENHEVTGHEVNCDQVVLSEWRRP